MTTKPIVTLVWSLEVRINGATATSATGSTPLEVLEIAQRFMVDRYGSAGEALQVLKKAGSDQ